MDRSKEDRDDRLIALLPQIESQARHYVLTYRPDINPNDIVLEASLSYLQKAAADPNFLSQTDEEIARRATMDGWNACRRQLDHRCVPLEPMDDDDGEEFESTFASDEPGPEEIAIASDTAERVQQTIAELKPAYQTICRGLMDGQTRKDIMAGIGTKPQAFRWYRAQLAAAFMAL